MRKATEQEECDVGAFMLFFYALGQSDEVGRRVGNIVPGTLCESVVSNRKTYVFRKGKFSIITILSRYTG